MEPTNHDLSPFVNYFIPPIADRERPTSLQSDRVITPALEILSLTVPDTPRLPKSFSDTDLEARRKVISLDVSSPFCGLDLLVFPDDYPDALSYNGILRSHYEILVSTYRRIIKGETSIRIHDPRTDKNFLPRVLGLIKTLLTRPTGREIIYALVKHTDKIITICPPPEEEPITAAVQGFARNQAKIYLNLDEEESEVFLRDSLGEVTSGTSPLEITLAHEMEHLRHMLELPPEEVDRRQERPPHISKVHSNSEEHLTITVTENKLRLEFGLPIREGHLGPYLPESFENLNDEDVLSYFHQVCMGGFIRAVHELLRRGIDPEARVPGRHVTPCMFAAYYGQLDVLKMLVATKKVDLDKEDDKRQTVLHYGIRSGNPEVVRYLLEGDKVNVKQADQGGVPLIHYAIKKLKEHCALIVGLLLKSNASPQAIAVDGSTALHAAAALPTGHPVIDLLFEHPLDPLKRDDNDRTPAFIATSQANFPLMRRLLTPDTLYERTQDDFSLMFPAVASGNIDVVKLLLELEEMFHNASFSFRNAPNPLGLSPLGYALKKARHKAGCLFIRDLLRLNFKFSKDPTQQSEDIEHFVSLFADAEEPLRSEMLRIIYRQPGMIEQAWCKENTLRDYAIQTNDPRLCQFAITYGASLNGALHVAVAAEQPEMVRFLLSIGASKKDEDAQKRTPLQLALELSRPKGIWDAEMLASLNVFMDYRATAAKAYQVIQNLPGSS